MIYKCKKRRSKNCIIRQLKKRFNARLLFNILSRIFKLYRGVPPTGITLSWKALTVDHSFCHVQYSFPEIVSIHIIKFCTIHSFVWRKNKFCLTYPPRGTLKLSKSRITYCTSEWYVYITCWLVRSEMDLVIEWGVLTRYREVNLFHEVLSRD